MLGKKGYLKMFWGKGEREKRYKGFAQKLFNAKDYLTLKMGSRGILSTWSREALEKDDIFSAILKISADLESLFFHKLFFEKDIAGELLERWTLGKYITWNLKLGLIDSSWADRLKEFNEIRNDVVHERGFIERLKLNPEATKRIKVLLYSMCDFIDQTRAHYVLDWGKEKKYGEYLDKKSKRFFQKYGL